MISTPEDEKNYNSATECNISQKRYANLKIHPRAHRPYDDLNQCEMCVINEKVKSKKFDSSLILHCHNENDNVSTCSICKMNGGAKLRDHCHILHNL